MESFSKNEFCELSNEEMLLVTGGESSWKETATLTAGSVLTANCIFVGAIFTPAVGVMALGMGLKLLGKAKLL